MTHSKGTGSSGSRPVPGTGNSTGSRFPLPMGEPDRYRRWTTPQSKRPGTGQRPLSGALWSAPGCLEHRVPEVGTRGFVTPVVAAALWRSIPVDPSPWGRSA